MFASLKNIEVVNEEILTRIMGSWVGGLCAAASPKDIRNVMRKIVENDDIWKLLPDFLDSSQQLASRQLAKHAEKKKAGGN